MTSSFSFELPQEEENVTDERQSSFIPFDKVFEYLVNSKRLSVSFAKESKALTEQIETAIEDLPEDAKAIIEQSNDGFNLTFFTTFCLINTSVISYWTCDEVFRCLLQNPAYKSRGLLGYSNPVTKKWDGFVKRVCRD